MDDSEKQFINNFLEAVEKTDDPKLSVFAWLFINAMYYKVGRERPEMSKEAMSQSAVEP